MNFTTHFDSQTYSDWLNLWMKESGGKRPEDFFKKLDRGVEIRPFYHYSETLSYSYHAHDMREVSVSEWINVHNESDAAVNSLILNALNSGASGLYINAQNDIAWEILLREVGLEYIRTTIDFRKDFLGGYRSLEAFLSLTRNENSAHKVFVVLPWYADEDLMQQMLSEINADFHGILIDLSEPQESGVPPGLVLALGIEMLNTLHRIKPQLIRRTGFLTTTIGQTFLDMVFNRALKIMCKAWLRKAGFNQEEVFIHTRTGRIDMAATDVYNNLLRNAVKTLTALISGADALTVLPYNFYRAGADAEAQRWARNQALMCIHESKLTYYSDPVAGSYAMEHLTNQLLDAALVYLNEIGQFANLSELFKSDVFNNAMTCHRQSILDEYEKGQKVSIGVTKYKPNEELITCIDIPFREGSPFQPFVIQNHFV